MRPPLFVIADDGLHGFRDAAHLTGYCEAIDVRNGVYGDAFDAEGRRLRLEVDAHDAVVVRLVDDEPAHAGELRRALSDALAQLGQAPAGDAPLGELVRAMSAFLLP